MFLLRKYEEGDLPACAVCLFESFFDCPVTDGEGRSLVYEYRL